MLRSTRRPPARVTAALAAVALAAFAAPTPAGALASAGSADLLLAPGTTGTAASPTTGTATATTTPPIGGTSGTYQVPGGPTFPGVYSLQATALTVTVGWFDRSTDEQRFAVHKRNLQGLWQVVHEVPTRNQAGGGDYSFVDTDRSVSGQCYMIAAVNAQGAGYTKEQCTVRPDPSRFPQTTPAAAQQWNGLSGVNDGTGTLHNSARVSGTHLKYGDQTFGVNLVWSESSSLWRIQAQGGPKLMHGQAVALRVWGGGWLAHGHQTSGINLVLSSTPAYEWHLVGAKPGTPIGDGSFALWNADAKDYVVAADRTWGVDLRWYQDTLPPPPPPPPPPPVGVSSFVASNCHTDRRPLEMWVQDLSAGTPFADMGRLDHQWEGSSCPYAGRPWTFTPPASGHQYMVRAVDFQAPGCTNDPIDGGCWRSQTTFVADSSGRVVATTIS